MPLISGLSVPPGPVTPPPGPYLQTGGSSHAGPGGREPHCGTTKKVMEGWFEPWESLVWIALSEAPEFRRGRVARMTREGPVVPIR
jgi:hypothetical protein